MKKTNKASWLKLWAAKSTVIFSLLFFVGSAQAQSKIQLAILLDSSGSMQGLIDQTKNQLWKIVNALATAKKDGKTPELEVALYQHGINDPTEEKDYLQQLVAMTTELDEISDKLFGIVASGGNEYTGAAIQAANNELVWSENADDYKVIFIAGNETMAQGPIDHKEAIAEAVKDGIIVNTIHAGAEAQGSENLWQEAAELGEGEFVNIDHNANIPHIESPYDPTILALNKKINETYVPYGQLGPIYKKRQLKADEESGVNLVSRSVTKGLSYYRNASWDLVDAVAEGLVKLEDIKDEDLPKEMQGMTLEEKKAYLDKKAKARKNLQIALTEVGKLRKEFVDKKLQEILGEQGKTIEKAMIAILKAQLEAKGFELES